VLATSLSAAISTTASPEPIRYPPLTPQPAGRPRSREIAVAQMALETGRTERLPGCVLDQLGR